MKNYWQTFWFKPTDVRQFAILRICFGYLSAVYLVQLLPFIAIHYSDTGWLANTPSLNLANQGTWSLLNLPMGSFSDLYSYLVVCVGITASITLMIGWYSRSSALISWIVLVSLWNRNPLLLDGDDAIIKIMAFYLLLSPAGWAWSLDAKKKTYPLQAPVWPLRLIQFQIALLYFVSGWVKFHSTQWLDGSILQYVLSHPHYSRFNCAGLYQYGGFLTFLSVLTAVIRWWELFFPFLLFNRYARRLSLLIGVIFHIGLLITMNLRWFPIIMLSLYPALLSNADFTYLLEKLKHAKLALTTKRT